MPLPGNITLIWVRGRYLTDSGNPLAGSLRFTRGAATLTDLDDNVILVSRTQEVDLDSQGRFACQLIASDDPDLLPSGFTYRVEDPTGRSFHMLVPAATPTIDDVTDPLNGQRVVDITDVLPAVTGTAGTVQLVEGPEGPEGPQGPPGGAAVTFTAGQTLSGHRIVTRQADGTVVYADSTNPAHVAVPLWLTLAAATNGADVEVQAAGVVDEPSWTWTPGPLYLGATGLLTQTAPTSPGAAFLVQIGYATSATSMVIDRQPSISLI